MKLSGYNARYRESILKSALKHWERRQHQDETGKRPLHSERDRDWNKEERRREKEKEKKAACWYKTGEDRSYDFPIFCPATPRGALAASWKEIAEEIKQQSKGLVKPKIAEQGGVSLKSLITKNSPTEAATCNKSDYPICDSGNGRNQNCHRTTKGGVGYTITCLNCSVDDIKSIYHGETSRTLHSRLKEHAGGLRNEAEDNPLYKHQQVFHEGIESKFNYTPHKFFKDPLTRQIDEGSRINMSLATNDLLMNSRSEFRQGALPRVQFVRGIQD